MLILPAHQLEDDDGCYLAAVLVGGILHQLRKSEVPVEHDALQLQVTEAGVVLLDADGHPADTSPNLPDWARRRLLNGRGLEFQRRLAKQMAFVFRPYAPALAQAVRNLDTFSIHCYINDPEVHA